MIEPVPQPFLPEEIDAGLKGLAVEMKSLAQQVTATKGEAQAWDLRRLRQRLPELLDSLTSTAAFVRDFSVQMSGFATPEVGEPIEAYTELLHREAQRVGLKLTGEYPDFEAFPVGLYVSLAQEQVRIGKRTTGALEPKSIMTRLKKEKDRLDRSSFNGQRFMKTLVAAYDLLVVERDPGKMGSSGVRLVAIHDLLTLRTGKSDYSRQAFAFDIYRLRLNSDLVYEGRQLQFEHGRTQSIEVPTGRGADALNALRVFPVENDG